MYELQYIEDDSGRGRFSSSQSTLRHSINMAWLSVGEGTSFQTKEALYSQQATAGRR